MLPDVAAAARNPAWIDHAIVIGDQDLIVRRLGDSQVEGVTDARSLTGDQASPSLRELVDELAQLRVARVWEDDHLRSWGVTRRDRFKAPTQKGQASDGRHHDRDRERQGRSEASLALGDQRTSHLT